MGLLDPLSERLSAAQAAHLLRRTTFVTNSSKAQSFVGMSIDTAVDLILNVRSTPPSKPIDPATGRTWVDNPSPNAQDAPYRAYVKGWWLELMLKPDDTTILEKLTLFWQNHFVTESDTVQDSRLTYRTNALLRKNALGNVKSFVKDITIDAGMLVYLNGNTNTNKKPNENYGRELQELFTIGKGKEIGPGDYSTYTEDDVKNAARVLTGWKVNRLNVEVTYISQLHDSGDKQFSADYGNRVIKGKTGATSGQDEMKELLDMIFDQPETARYIVRKLYRWFVFYQVNQNIEDNVIAPLAEKFRADNFEIKPLLKTLLSSQHFFEQDNIGAMIKTPMDFLAGTANHFGFSFPTDATQRLQALQRLGGIVLALQQDPMDPPNVAGWKAYYQEPSFYHLWLNSATLPYRYITTDTMVYGGGRLLPVGWQVDTSAFISALMTDASDAIAMITKLSDELFTAYPLTAEQITYLAENALMAGAPVYEWTTIWNAYKAAPTNSTKKKAAEDRLKQLMRFMFRMAEYQLM